MTQHIYISKTQPWILNHSLRGGIVPRRSVWRTSRIAQLLSYASTLSPVCAQPARGKTKMTTLSVCWNHSCPSFCLNSLVFSLPSPVRVDDINTVWVQEDLHRILSPICMCDSKPNKHTHTLCVSLPLCVSPLSLSLTILFTLTDCNISIILTVLTLLLYIWCILPPIFPYSYRCAWHNSPFLSFNFPLFLYFSLSHPPSPPPPSFNYQLHRMYFS